MRSAAAVLRPRAQTGGASRLLQPGQPVPLQVQPQPRPGRLPYSAPAPCWRSIILRGRLRPSGVPRPTHGPDTHRRGRLARGRSRAVRSVPAVRLQPRAGQPAVYRTGADRGRVDPEGVDPIAGYILPGEVPELETARAAGQIPVPVVHTEG